MKQLVDFILSTVSITAFEAEHIAKHFHPYFPKKGDTILQPGQVSDDYIYLKKGILRTYLYDLEGNEITTNFFTSDNVAFEITSFFNRVPSQTFMQAVTDCEAFRISYGELNTLFHCKPSFRDFGRAILVKEFIRAQKRNYSMINKTAQQRYKELSIANPEILKSTPLKHIATYLGITDSTLSRLRRNIG